MIEINRNTSLAARLECWLIVHVVGQADRRDHPGGSVTRVGEARVEKS